MKVEVFYERNRDCDYYPDLVVNDMVIIERKAPESLGDEHSVQLLDYLRATQKR